MRKITDEAKRDAVRMAYKYTQMAGSALAGEAYRSGFMDALELAGADENTMYHLEDEFNDLFDSYIEGEWR